MDTLKKKKKKKSTEKNKKGNYGFFFVDGGFDLPTTTLNRQNEQPSSLEKTRGRTVFH